VRAINKQDLVDALRQVKASVSDQDLQMYEEWNEKYGAGK
jgi:SpoVK/Ycf46/Vps4 family AAA+-type ATPase